MEEANNKKITWSKISGIIVAIIVATLIQHFLFNPDNGIDKSLKTTAEETNKNCPMYVDSLTRLDNTEALPNKTFQYNYSVKIDSTTTNINELKTNLRSSILNSIKTSPSLKEFRDNNVTLVYNYSNNSGSFLFKFQFAPSDYK